MAREIPYHPMGQRKEVSESRMQEILSKHAHRLKLPEPKVEVSKAPLQWNKPARGATGVTTVCGRYSCSKVTLNGKLTYEVWRLIPNHWFTQIAIGLDSFEAAKHFADEDAKHQ